MILLSTQKYLILVVWFSIILLVDLASLTSVKLGGESFYDGTRVILKSTCLLTIFLLDLPILSYLEFGVNSFKWLLRGLKITRIVR